MASLKFQKEAAAFLYSVLGVKADTTTFDTIGNNIEKGIITAEDYVDSLLNSAAGQALYAGQSDYEILAGINQSLFGRQWGEVQATLDSKGLAGAIVYYIDAVFSYVGPEESLWAALGTDSALLKAQADYDQKINAILAPSYTAADSAAGVSSALALYYMAGIDPVMSTVYKLGAAIDTDPRAFAEVASQFVKDRAQLQALTDEAFVKLLFGHGYEREPTGAELSSAMTFLTGGGDRGQLMVDVITGLRGTVSAGDQAAQQYFLHDTTPHEPGFKADLAHQEQVASLFLAIPQRGVDAQGLDDWSSYLDKHQNTFNSLTTKLISSVEFQKKGAQLSGDDFIQHVFTAVRGAAATDEQLAHYRTLNGDKTLITLAVIDELRNSTATDAATVTQQHAFEYNIANNLNYKTVAALTAPQNGGVTGTVNSGANHTLSHAEISVLLYADLNITSTTYSNIVDLKFADHLHTLKITAESGSSAQATVNLSDNGVSNGVKITVGVDRIILNASSGDDTVILSQYAVDIRQKEDILAASSNDSHYNLGAGNDRLQWLGSPNGQSSETIFDISEYLRADGGEGIDTISANYITKKLQTSTFGSSTTIKTSAAQFTSFEKIDLGGYVGGTSATLNGKPVTINSGHLFDYGVLTGKATADEITNAGKVINGAPFDLGRLGFALSSKADNVSVINVGGGDAAQLDVTGYAGADSLVSFTFLKDAASKFDIHFDYKFDDNTWGVLGIDAGTIKVNSSSSSVGGTALTNINIRSDGENNLVNSLNLGGVNTDVTTLSISGKNQLKLNLETGYSHVRTIDAAANTRGVDITANVSGSGDGVVLNFLKLFPASGNSGQAIIDLFGFKGDDVNIVGTGQADKLSVSGNSQVTGGAGADVFTLLSSTPSAGVTVRDFSLHQDKLVDVKSGLALSDNAGGTRVADYGDRSDAAIQGALDGFISGGSLTSTVNFLKTLLGIQDKALAQVGVVGTSAGSYLIIDQNKDGALDNNDTLAFLAGVNHADAAQIYYAANAGITTNGVQSEALFA
ncbi:ABC-type protease/lipase transport system, ATPase and permease components [Serratia entomophila]|uniref:DUF4214 domain-containing protein n=3 Tax=Serratia entomophila TaxID=42906 RepID=UPI00217C4292|nr:DUF4214 domain-containing protein [Serratia entomophila]CAI1613332.1 ABC-type protease/lipase transport system, ATPase and permease components [Serratia entomophila]CAI1802124.1 ABC-type protease/lipase transport system, ATPase and permease components [Serratia entomophila]CAI2926840.1 ABC-type protease/lipase transport system, ATPase and permease components [Serratia entomophila]